MAASQYVAHTPQHHIQATGTAAAAASYSQAPPMSENFVPLYASSSPPRSLSPPLLRGYPEVLSYGGRVSATGPDAAAFPESAGAAFPSELSAAQSTFGQMFGQAGQTSLMLA